MKKLSNHEMKNLMGGVAQTVMPQIMGHLQDGNNCYVDICDVNTVTGEVSNCQCDLPVNCS